LPKRPRYRSRKSRVVLRQRFNSVMRWTIAVVESLLICPVAWAAEDAAQVVAELRHQQQHQQAEEYASDEWRRNDLSDRQRAELAIQLALLYTEQASAAPPELRESLWHKADGACVALLDGWPENPRRILVEVQRALVALARGQQARDRGEVPRALENLRAASRGLQEVADSVGRRLIELRLRGAANGVNEELSVLELESLEGHLAFYLAQSQRQLGLCYPAGSSDRDDALLQAERRLAPLAQRTPADELVWYARIEQLACYLDLGRADTARRVREAWLHENPPPHIAARLAVEESSAATPAIANGQQRTGTTRPEQSGFDAELQNAALARSNGKPGVAAEMYRRFALRQLDHPRAVEAHRLAVLGAADAVRAAAADNRAAAAESYEELLREHLLHWQSSNSANEVRLWLGQLLAARRDWPGAIDVLRQTPAGAPELAQSVPLFAQCYEQRLQQLSGDPNSAQQTAALLSEATHFLQPIITGSDNRWPDGWTDLQCDTATTIARLHLRYSPQRPEYAERLLSAALSGAATAPDSAGRQAWAKTARVLLVTALVRNWKLKEATQLAPQVAAAPSAALFECLSSIDRMLTASDSATDEWRALGELALKILSFLDGRRAELESAESVRLDAIRAAALAATGNRATALTLYASLAGSSSGDGNVHERYATLLGISDTSAELRQALAQWQVVEIRSRRGSPRWRRARQARLELLSRLGETAEAEKLLRLTRLLYPDWDSGAEPAGGN
jgi:hypothetical protein